VQILAFVGGQAAAVRSATLSPTEVGIVEVQVEIPRLGADLYSLTLRIAGVDYPAGSVNIPQAF
jgi:uncharacterized protein (TIGR03437 family)